MDFDKARKYFTTIEASTQKELRQDLLEQAVTYAQYRSKWPLLSFEERRDLDSSRTASHNAFIDACNILSRNMLKAGEDNSWRAALGDDRKVIGDFACFVALFLGLKGR